MSSQFKGFITVRSSSKRLPRKCFLPFGDETILSHVIKRSIWYDIEPIVCTTTNKEDDEIEKIAQANGVTTFRGSDINKLKRWSDCAEHLNIINFHTIDADDPFFDGDQMRESMHLLNSGDFDLISPTKSSSNGGASVGYSLTSNIVKKCVNELPEDTDTEMMWNFLERLPGLRIKQLIDSEPDINIRLTLDYEEDYWLLESVRRILGNLATRREIINLFESNPDLFKINWFRNLEWKKAQQQK